VSSGKERNRSAGLRGVVENLRLRRQNGGMLLLCYRFTVWVGHNDAPVAPGGGSCIFLHLRAGPQDVTAGCTAFEPEPMEKLLHWLDPKARPFLVQLPEVEYRARAAEWGLPAITRRRRTRSAMTPIDMKLLSLALARHGSSTGAGLDTRRSLGGRARPSKACLG
jgi:hypothetical protein